jgi:hypothetical protein
MMTDTLTAYFLLLVWSELQLGVMGVLLLHWTLFGCDVGISQQKHYLSQQNSGGHNGRSSWTQAQR